MPAAVLTIRSVLRRPALRRLIPAFLAFSVAEWASWIGLIVYAYSRGGPVEAGIVAGLVFLPSVIVAPAASVFGDRRPRAQVLAGAYAILALSLAAAAVAIAVAPALVAYLMATLAATSITLVRPAHSALLPEVAETPDSLAWRTPLPAPSRVSGRSSVHSSPGCWSASAERRRSTRLWRCSSSCRSSPSCHWPGRPVRWSRRLASTRREGLRSELGAGLRTIIGDRRLLAVMAILSGAIALLGAFNVLLTVIAIDLLGGDESSIGYVAALAGLGSVVGAGSTGFLMGRERLALAYVGAGALFAAAVAVIGLGPGPILVLACVVASGVGWAFVYVEALTLAQRLAGDDVMSRVFGVMESSMMASQSLGALLVPLLIVLLGPMGAIVACGVAFGLVVAIAGPTLIRADRLDPSRLRRLQAMRGVPMFGPLSATVLERLVTSSTTIEVEAGRTIVTAGEIGDRFYVILAGDVEVVTPAGGRRQLASGNSFGEIALLRDIPRTATVTALTPTELLALDRGAFLEALTGQPRSRALADAESRRRLDADAAAEPSGLG